MVPVSPMPTRANTRQIKVGSGSEVIRSWGKEAGAGSSVSVWLMGELRKQG